jgi:hypothetical protein
MHRFASAIALCATVLAAPADAQTLDAAFAERFGALALDCVHREYPNKIAHVLSSDADARPPRELTPAFYGCYDWHSAVHGHWLLARLARTFPDTEVAARARAALGRSLTAENVAGEVRYLEGEGRVSFERPYGLAWLLQLAAELREWDDPDARAWAGVLEPLERAAAYRLKEWMPKLTHPIRGGEHFQTAFAFGLVHDWARTADDSEMADLVFSRIADFYFDDRGCPLDYEPSGHDFFSSCLAEADLVRRVSPPGDYAAWLGAFLPEIPLYDDEAQWLAPAVVSDPGDPKLAHLDGLNLSRAWMLEGMIAGLPTGDPRLPALAAAARRHREAGLRAVTGEHYEGGHWLGSFAVYLMTGRGGGAVISSGPFDVVFRGIDREAARDVVLYRAEKALADATGFLGLEYDGRVLIEVSPRYWIPHQFRNWIKIPAGRIVEPDESGISIVHELTHVVAASAYRPDRFYDDGLAVYLQSRFGVASSYPNFGRDLHRETARAAADAGGNLPLAEAEAARNASTSGDQRRLAYLQEGSFTRFLIERDGVDKYLRVFFGESLEEVYGKDLAVLEAEWLELLGALEPEEAG